MPQLHDDSSHGRGEEELLRLQVNVVRVQLRRRIIRAGSDGDRRGALLVHRATSLVHVQSATREGGASDHGVVGVGHFDRDKGVQIVQSEEDSIAAHDATSRFLHARYSRHVHAARQGTSAAVSPQGGAVALVQS